MAEKISIDLTQQEQLLLQLRNLVNEATSLQSDLVQVAADLPKLSTSGEFYNRLAAEGKTDLQRFVLKAQTLLDLTVVLHKHAEQTNKALIDIDKLLALDMANSLLNRSDVAAETKTAIRSDPAGYVKQLQTDNAKSDSELSQLNKQGISTSDCFLSYQVFSGENDDE